MVEGPERVERPEDTGTILTACPSLFDAFSKVLHGIQARSRA